MSAFKGTPGPWAWGHNSASSDAIHCIEVTAKGRTGSVAYMQSYTTDDYDDRAETIANAHLIAAAPELLEALIEADRILGNLGCSPENSPRAEARAAIEKATGEQP